MSNDFPRVHATVRWFSDQEGWGVADAPEAPGGIFVHFAMIQGEPNEYRTLREGEAIEVELEVRSTSTRTVAAIGRIGPGGRPGD